MDLHAVKNFSLCSNWWYVHDQDKWNRYWKRLCLLPRTLACIDDGDDDDDVYLNSVVVNMNLQVEKDKLVLHLQKAVPRPWAAELDQTGLETDRPEDDKEGV